MASEFGSVETQVRRDVAALVSSHPMGEGLAELAYMLAHRLDSAELQGMAVSGISRELRETLMELARLGVGDDDDLEAELSRPDMPA